MTLRGTAREAAAEFLGMFVLIMFGVGVVAQVVLSGMTAGDYFSINVGWGLGVTMGVYVAGGISGAHLNPAVTLALAVRRGFAWAKVGPYVAAQFAGAFVASAVVYLTYREALDKFDGGVRQVTGSHPTAGIWATYPQPFLSTVGGVLDQIVGTALLVGVICALTDRRNNPPAPGFAPVVVGALVLGIGATFGFNSGYAINPARDLGPRLFTAVAGWGADVFRAGNAWWWVPVVAPCIGGLVGVFVYDFAIGNHHPADAEGVGA